MVRAAALRYVIATVALLPLLGCEAQQAATINDTANAANISDAANAADAAGEMTDATAQIPDHNYTARVGDIYYYTAAQSQNDINAGMASSEAVGFKNVNCDSRQKVCLVSVNGHGWPTSSVTCDLPCKIVHAGDGSTYVFNPATLMGSALSDAIDGKMVKTTLYPRQPKVDVIGNNATHSGRDTSDTTQDNSNETTE